MGGICFFFPDFTPSHIRNCSARGWNKPGNCLLLHPCHCNFHVPRRELGVICFLFSDFTPSHIRNCSAHGWNKPGNCLLLHPYHDSTHFSRKKLGGICFLFPDFTPISKILSLPRRQQGGTSQEITCFCTHAPETLAHPRHRNSRHPTLVPSLHQESRARTFYCFRNTTPSQAALTSSSVNSLSALISAVMDISFIEGS